MVYNLRALYTKVLLILFLSFLPVWAETYLPEDTEILAEVNSSVKLKRLKVLAKTSKKADNLDLLYLVAKQYIELGKQEADPRYYSYASSVLSAQGKEAPERIKLLQADILQYQHRFKAALKLLDQIIKVKPDDQEALLMRAAIYTELADYARSNRDCKELRNYNLEITCLALNQSLTGQEQQAYKDLKAMELGQDAASLWSLTITAEVAARLGLLEEAENYYARALAINPNDVYLLGSYADFLLDQDHNQEVLDLLETKQQIESLALRYNLAAELQSKEGVQRK